MTVVINDQIWRKIIFAEPLSTARVVFEINESIIIPDDRVIRVLCYYRVGSFRGRDTTRNQVVENSKFWKV